MKINFTDVAAFYLAMAVIVVIRDLVFYDIFNFFWFCDIGLVLFAIAFFNRNIQFIKGLINIGLVAQSIFLLSIVVYAGFKIQMNGLPVVLFHTSWVNILVSIIIHLLSTNLALFLTYKEKNGASSLAYSLGVLLFLYVMSLLLTPPSYNINYVFSSDFLGFNIPFYTFLWPVLAFVPKGIYIMIGLLVIYFIAVVIYSYMIFKH